MFGYEMLKGNIFVGSILCVDESVCVIDRVSCPNHPSVGERSNEASTIFMYGCGLNELHKFYLISFCFWGGGRFSNYASCVWLEGDSATFQFHACHYSASEGNVQKTSNPYFSTKIFPFNKCTGKKRVFKLFRVVD